MIFYIYKITNKINEKIYIGKTSNITRRWNAHKKLSSSNQKHFYLHNAISKYGIDNFFIEVIGSDSDENIAYEKETQFIIQYKSNKRELGYNLTTGGRGIITNQPVSLETRSKISNAQIGSKRRTVFNITEITRQKLSEVVKNRGQLPNDKKKEILDLFDSGKYTKKQLAKLFSIRYETVRFIIQYHRKHGFKTEEEKHITRSQAKLGKSLPETVRQKISNSLTGTVFSDERKNNISRSLKGKILSDEIKDKISMTVSGKSNYLEIKQSIIELFNSGEYSRIELSKKFGLHRATVSKIIKNYQRKNIDD